MNVNYLKKGKKWQIHFVIDEVDPFGLCVAGDFNAWNPAEKKTAFKKGSHEVTVSIPEGEKLLHFKLFNNINSCWCEIYDNSELYAGLEPYFSRNELGTVDIVIPLKEKGKESSKEVKTPKTAKKTTPRAAVGRPKKTSTKKEATLN